jgi:hypothetical protein
VSSRFWPVAEPAQADYERLRALVLAGERCDQLLAARRFERRGLAGLISWPGLDLALTVPRPGQAGARKRPPEQGECGLPRLAFDRQEDHPHGEA